MTKKQIKALMDRATVLENAIKKNSSKVIWEMVAELVEIELELEKECNR